MSNKKKYVWGPGDLRVVKPAPAIEQAPQQIRSTRRVPRTRRKKG